MGRKSREKRERQRSDQSTPGVPASFPKRAVPPDWGNDLLSEFLQVAHENAFHVFTRHRPVFDLIALIHATFDVAVGIAARAEPQWLAFFVGRSHSAFLAASRLALSGQVAESFAPLRVAIETAWYALHVSADPEGTERMKVWLSRDDSEETKWKTIKEFRAGEMKATHADRDPETARILEGLYERCIAFGAHPNPSGVLTSIIRHEDEKTLTHNILYLNAQVLPLMFALKTGAEVATSILRLFGIMYPREYLQAEMPARLDLIIGKLNTVFQPYVPRAG